MSVSSVTGDKSQAFSASSSLTVCSFSCSRSWTISYSSTCQHCDFRREGSESTEWINWKRRDQNDQDHIEIPEICIASWVTQKSVAKPQSLESCALSCVEVSNSCGEKSTWAWLACSIVCMRGIQLCKCHSLKPAVGHSALPSLVLPWHWLYWPSWLRRLIRFASQLRRSLASEAFAARSAKIARSLLAAVPGPGT